MKNFKGILFAIISSATFGLIPLFSIPLLQSGMHDPTILFYRLGLAALIIGVIALISKRSFKIQLLDAMMFIALGFLYAATAMGLLRSYDFIPSGVATTIHFLYPLVVTMIMVLFFHERSSGWLIGAALLSLGGVALLSWGGGESTNEVKGVLTVLVTVVTYAAYIVGVNRTRVARIDSLVLTFYVLLSGSLMFLVYALSTTGIEAIPNKHAMLDVFLLALFPTVLSNFTLVLAVKNIGSTMTSILGSMEPLTAILVGIFHFGETFDFESGIGLSIIVVAVIIVIMQDRTKNATT